MLNGGSDTLDEIPGVSKTARYMKEIEFDYDSMNIEKSLFLLNKRPSS